MNRMEEYEALTAMLESVPLSDCVARAKARRSRSRYLWRPLAAAAVLFLSFVGLVNLCPPVAAACRAVPVLAQLAEAVSFSPSLQKAVAHDYIQTVDQSQSANGVTAQVDYLIVDQKRVVILYSLSAEPYLELGADVDVSGNDGSLEGFGVLWNNAPGLENGHLRQATVEFTEGETPDSLCLRLRVYDLQAEEAKRREENHGATVREYLAEFAFHLELDPAFTAQGRTVSLHKTVELDGQRITFTDLEIYPTHIRLNVAGDPANTAWLRDLQFHLELADGTEIGESAGGITGTGDANSPAMTSFRAESSYFEAADCVRLVITGAAFLDKDRETIGVNLVTGETDPLPQGVTLERADRTGEGWELTFRSYQPAGGFQEFLSPAYYDEAGGAYSFSGYGQGTLEDGGREVYYLLEGYTEDTVRLTASYSHFWDPAQPVILEIP